MAIDSLPFLAAFISAVEFEVETALTFAPFCNNKSTIFVRPEMGLEVNHFPSVDVILTFSQYHPELLALMPYIRTCSSFPVLLHFESVNPQFLCALNKNESLYLISRDKIMDVLFTPGNSF